MKVKLKITHDPNWRGNLRYHERYWVHLPDGRYFPVFSGVGGTWYQLHAPANDYPSMDAAVAAALRHLFAKVDKTETWRKCRAKIQVFTFTAREHSCLRVPRKRKLSS